jgi:hypothetical protein
MPVVVGVELWLYYGGLGPPQDGRGPPLALNGEQVHGSLGLATLRLDGFTHLQLRRGTSAGQMTTVPFVAKDGQPLRLQVNADCSPRARLTVEVLDARSGQPLPGYSRRESTPVQANGVRQVVRRGNKDRLPVPGGKRLALRFWFDGSSGGLRLYGLGFVRGQ